MHYLASVIDMWIVEMLLVFFIPEVQVLMISLY